MTWLEVLAVVVSYCAPLTHSNPAVLNECRDTRYACVKRAVAQNPTEPNAADLINTCLSKPEAYPPVVVKASPAPVVVASPTPIPSASPSVSVSPEPSPSASVK